MEYLDTYDENGKFLGKEERNIVHRDALWHNTVHCWLYDKEGYVYFQKIEDRQALYTTASGHVSAGETIKQAFGREIREEIGINIDYENAEIVDVVKYVLDRKLDDGSYFRDRAFANVYVYEFNGKMDEFDYDEVELDGIARVNAKETLDLFNDKIDKIDSKIYTNSGGIIEKELTKEDFLVNNGETLIEKYGMVLDKVIELTEK